MRVFYRKLFTVIFFLFFIINSVKSQNIEQQQDTTLLPPIEKESSYLSIDLNYISDAVFMGRKDSISAPYIYPSLTYHHKSGFYATGSFSYLTKADQSRVDMSISTIGYDFDSKKISGDFSLTKYFFSDKSYNVIAEVEADLTAKLSYDFDIVNLTATGITFFNSDNSSDLFLSGEISHDFVTNNEKFQFSPTAGIYFGSQNFYDQYFVSYRYSSGRGHGGNGAGTGSGTGGTTQTTTSISVEESEKFNLMAVELSLPSWYMHKKFTVSFLPTLVIPQNPATLIVDDVVVKEELDTTFYWMLGVSYKFD